MGTQIIILGEYDDYFVSRADGSLSSIVNGPIAGAPKGIIGGSAALHHAAFIGPDKFVWVIGENLNNISALNSVAATLSITKTAIGNVQQVVAYCNGGSGLGDGVAVLTLDGKIILMGCTQSGFRGDGTEGNAAETAPYQVVTPEPIVKIQAGSYFFALGKSGTVYRWGGTKANQNWAPYSCGAFSATPDLTHIGKMALPEPIKDIVGGGDWSYAIGQSNRIYGWGYGPLWFGVPSITQNKLGYWDLTAGLNLPGTLAKLAVGPEATYALMTSGDLYAWGNNTQAAIGNGQEAAYVQQTKVADWGYTSRALMQTTPVKINPSGVIFADVHACIADAFYAYAEDSNGYLWAWGRNKGGVIPDGKNHGTPEQQSQTPNAWDVLSPVKLTIFPMATSTPPPTTPPPVVSNPCPSIVKVQTVITWSDGHVTNY